jgi:hypothetical protein
VSIPEVESRSRLIAFLKKFFAEKGSGGGGDGAPTNAEYVTLETNGTLTNERVLTAGTNISLTDGGAGGTVTINSTAGGGDVSVSGTPSNNEVPTWTDATTIKGEGNLTFDGTTLAVAGNETIITSNTGLTNDRALFVQNTADHCNIEVDAAAEHEANIIFSENTTVKWAIGNKASNDDLQFRINGWAQKAALSQAGDLQIDGDLTVTGNDIKGSGGTVITMDATNDVNLAGDLTVNGGDLFIKSTAVADLFFRRETASLVDGDDLGNVIFQATEDGTNIAWSPAVIKAECSETFVEGSNEGTRLKFLTTPNGTAASTTNMTLDGNGNLDINGALTLGAGVTSALGSEITTDVSAVDEWTKVAEADISDSSYQIGTATINVLLIGYEGSEEMYLASCNILAHKFAPSRSHLQVDIIQDEGSVAWDTSDFSLTQNTSVAELWVKAPAANHTCYATITNGTTGGDSAAPPYKSDWILTPNQTWGSLVPLTDTATTTNVKKRFDSLVIDGDLTVSGNDIKDSGGSAAITFDGSQNVGIGASPSAGLKLDVKGALRTTDFMEVSGNLGLKDDLIFGASLGINNIIDSLGATRIYIDSGAHMSLASRLGTVNLVIQDSYTDIPTYLSVGGNIEMGGNLVAEADATTYLEFNATKIEFIHAGKERMEMDGNGIGMLGATPIAAGVAITGDLEPSGDVTVGGDLTVAGNDIKGSGGTAITMDVSNNVTVANDLTIAGGDIRNSGLMAISLSGQNVTLGNNLTVPGQVVPGYDPGILAQNIFDPSSYALFTITNDEDYLYIVDWDTGATSTTNPKIAFSAPASGKVIVDVSCYMDDTSSTGAGPYIYAALSSNYGTAGTKISKTDASIVGNGEKRIWYPDESDRGVRNFSFYASGLTGGSTYTWYLYMRRWSDGDTNRVICGGDYPLFEMRVRPIYSSALIYTT